MAKTVIMIIDDEPTVLHAAERDSRRHRVVRRITTAVGEGTPAMSFVHDSLEPV